ncbi:hypothetical protein SynBIOSU31_01453 [Synechococcus sp. BIOS-U3-1]|nr:hypothetical protein SynBIOSU31_01453 [Synechococcus sp. BIOS-U3-1]
MIREKNGSHGTGFKACDQGIASFKEADLIGLCTLDRRGSPEVWILAYGNLHNAGLALLKKGDQLAEAHGDVPIDWRACSQLTFSSWLATHSLLTAFENPLRSCS